MAAHQLNSRNDLRYALVIGVYNMPAFVRPDDAFGWSIFADGSGAFVIEKTETPGSGYLGGVQLTDGTQWDFIGIYSGAARNPMGTELEFVIMVIAVSCVKLLSAHNSTQHTSRKHKV
jgi:3-oxoacyl-[acyl-carrier-protein] synthase III